MKDTLREFRTYLTKSKDKHTTTGADDINQSAVSEEEDDEDEADDVYELEEVELVDRCVSLMDFCYVLLRSALEILTTVADLIDSEKETSSTSVSASVDNVVKAVSNMTLQSAITSETKEDHVLDGDKKSWCRKWVADILAGSEELNDALVDLGAELYPPLEVTKVGPYYNVLWEVTFKVFSVVMRVSELAATNATVVNTSGKSTVEGTKEVDADVEATTHTNGSKEAQQYISTSESIRNFPILLARLHSLSSLT